MPSQFANFSNLHLQNSDTIEKSLSVEKYFRKFQAKNVNFETFS